MITSTNAITLVVGPAGSGKSVLLENVAQRVREPVHWWRPRSDSPDLVGELASAVTVANALGPSRTWLIVDDLRQVAETSIDALTNVAMRARETHVRCVIATRVEPSSAAAGLVSEGAVDVIGADQLRFSSCEVEDLFRTVYHSPITAESATLLASQLDGWATGLQLSRLTAEPRLLSRDDHPVLAAELSESVWSLFERDVVSEVDQDDLDLLLLTSASEVLTGALVNALLDVQHSEVRLDALARRHLLIASTGERPTYRPHAVLRARLRQVLAETLDPATWRWLHRRAARLLELGGWAAEAVRAYARAEDWDDASRLLREPTTQLTDESAGWLLRRRPARATHDPEFLLVEARRLLRRGSVRAAVAAYERAGAASEDDDLRRVCRDEQVFASVWSPSSGPDPGAAPADALAHRTATELRQVTRESPPAWRLTTPLARGVSALLHVQLDSAVVALAEVPRSRDRPGPTTELGGRLALAAVDLVRGPDAASSIDLDRVTVAAEDADLIWLARQARGLRHASRCLHGDPSEAQQLTDLVAACLRDDDRWGAVLIALVAGVVALRVDTGVGTERLLTIAAGLTDDLDAPGVAVRIDGLLAALRLRTLARMGVLAARPSASDRLGDDVVESQAPEVPSPTGSVAAGSTASEIRCLGAFSIRIRGTVVDLRTLRPRPRAVLMMLATHHRRALHRERLVDTFWPDASFRAGLRGLQVAVAEIRRCLRSYGASVALRRSADAYVLELDETWDQLAEFERLAARCDRSRPSAGGQDDLRLRLAAVELYEGELLPEAGPAEWVIDERERLRGLAARLAAEAAELALSLHSFTTGVGAARRSLAIDPHQDRPWLLLVQLQEAMGDQRAADRTRRDHGRARADDAPAPAPASTTVPIRRPARRTPPAR